MTGARSRAARAAASAACSRRRSFAALVCCAALCACGGAPAPRRASSPPDRERVSAIELPARASHRRAAPPPPELPSELTEPPDLTVVLERRAAGATPTPIEQETVTRSARRVHVQVAGADGEWLFVRNPLDARRASGAFIDHARQVIVEFDESELRLARIARGWADLVGLGAPPELIAGFRTSGQRQALGGFEFEEAAAPGAAGLDALWWSRAAAAPLRLSRPGAGAVVLLGVRPGIDGSLLEPPERRFPGYRVVDVADDREAQHEIAEGRASPAVSPAQPAASPVSE